VIEMEALAKAKHDQNPPAKQIKQGSDAALQHTMLRVQEGKPLVRPKSEVKAREVAVAPFTT
jgi:hypothetical protein